jgi:hypothetical protein
MRGALRLLLCAGLFLPARVAAQSSDSEVATVDATVIKSLSLTKLSSGSLTFGLSAQGTTDQINYKAAMAAKYRAVGEVSTTVDVSFTTATLTNGGSSLTYTPTVAGNTVDNKNTATVLSSGVDITLHGTTGEHYLWVGGNLVVPSSATLGAYTGTWTLTLAYTGT